MMQNSEDNVLFEYTILSLNRLKVSSRDNIDMSFFEADRTKHQSNLIH